MPRKNAFLAKQQARTEALCRTQRLFTIQQCSDMMLIAAADEFGFGADRLVRLKRKYDEVFAEYAKMAISDGADDPDIVYTREKVDRKLKQILGDAFSPWEERYL